MLSAVAIFDLFSKRQKRLRGEVSDIYTYATLPLKLRVQLVQIIEAGIGPEHNPSRFSGAGSEAPVYKAIHDALCREYGVFRLHKEASSHWQSLADYLLQTKEVEHVLDIVELCLRMIDTHVREGKLGHDFWHAERPDDTIAEVNERFRENGVGYEFASGQIVRIDSRIVHADVVKPTLELLSDMRFKGANDEFLKAHEHYRHGRHKECLAECLKAFESTLKSICSIKGWRHDRRATAKDLIEVCQKKGLFATFMQSHIGNLRSILESGVPTLRNQLGGHGQGTAITNVSESTARFALHLTASTILFFFESSQGK